MSTFNGTHNDGNRNRRQLPVRSALTLGLSLMLAVGISITAHAQSFSVIYNFTGGQDGAHPFAGLTVGSGNALYGTAFGGGTHHFGTVFELSHSGSGWILTPLYSFAGNSDGAGPVARVVIGPDGGLYGSTSAGGEGTCNNHNGYLGCGTVFKLRPPATMPHSVIVNWSSNVIYRFSGSNGAYPQGDLTFDDAGNIYGTTINGGSHGWGLIYSLTQSNGHWNENVLYQVQNNGDGQYAWSGVVRDSSGNLYGVFSGGGPDQYGAIYKLTHSGSGWVESTVHAFTFHGNDGAAPQGGLVTDRSGNIYGSTVHNPTGGGVVFELSPSGGGWSYDVLYGLTGGIGLGPYDKLVMDSAGNLYGTTFGDGRYGRGSVFKLTSSFGGWTYETLHDFTGGTDGSNPMSSLVLDSEGNLYGTASAGGSSGNGVVFQIRP